MILARFGPAGQLWTTEAVVSESMWFYAVGMDLATSASLSKADMLHAAQAWATSTTPVSSTSMVAFDFMLGPSSARMLSDLAPLQFPAGQKFPSRGKN